MPVLCECTSVIIKSSSMKLYFKGGDEAFHKLIPNETACSNGELYRVGFMVPFEVKDYVDLLEKNSLQFQKYEGFKLYLGENSINTCCCG